MINHPRHIVRRKLWPLLCICMLATPAAAEVITYHHDLDPNHTMFGNLKQGDVPDCGNGMFACGPTAAVNSFAFLQRKFPDIYDHSLIPDTNGNMMIDYQEMVDTAVALGSPNYMDCAVCDGGTLLGKFESGKRKWINERAPGSTIFKRRDNPGWEFLFGELWDMEDVELLLGFFNDFGQRIGGHYVTLTKFWWQDTDMDSNVDLAENAMIGFVDPADGMLKMQRLSQSLTGNSLFTDYGIGGVIPGQTNGFIASTRIESAISESPIPEPATIVLISLAIGCAMSHHRRRAA